MRHPLFIVLISLLSVCSLYGQMPVEKGKADLGLIERGSERIVETSFVNPGITELQLLRVQGEPSYDVRTDTMRIGIGERMRIRIKFNPSEKGRFNDEILFYFNDLTYALNLSSEVKYVDHGAHTPCPDFEQGAALAESDWQAYFKIIDRDSKEPLPGAELTLEGKSGVKLVAKADRKGEVLITVPIDFYDIHAKQEGYAKFRQENYINRRNKDFTLQLMAGEQGSVLVWRPSQRLPTPEEETQTPEEPVLVPVPEPTVVFETPTAEEAEAAETELSDFSIAEYRPNNVVFLIDVSTSMRQEERIELLKSAMIELAGMLRPDDIISIVTYATSTDVVISGQRADDVEKIASIIAALEADGKTAGEAGLKQAYKLCERAYIADGNNHVYLATDGAFNAGYDKMYKRVSRAQSEDLHLTILAIKSNKWSDRRMIELAEAGGGQHVKLEDISDQQALKTLIRQQSKR